MKISEGILRGSPFNWLTAPPCRNFLLVSNLNLLPCSFRLFILTLLSWVSKEKPTPFFSWKPCGDLKTGYQTSASLLFCRLNIPTFLEASLHEFIACLHLLQRKINFWDLDCPLLPIDTKTAFAFVVLPGSCLICDQQRQPDPTI